MGSESEYLANVSLAAHWRKLASNAAEAADRRQIQEAADRRKADKG